MISIEEGKEKVQRVHDQTTHFAAALKKFKNIESQTYEQQEEERKLQCFTRNPILQTQNERRGKKWNEIDVQMFLFDYFY